MLRNVCGARAASALTEAALRVALRSDGHGPGVGLGLDVRRGPDWLLVRNVLTRSRRAWAWAPSSWLLEAICSVPAAACSVTWAMPWVALETSSELAACWTVAVAISEILAAVALTLSTIFFSASPVSPLSCAPCCTCCVDSLMRLVISPAALLDRSASLRTSSATTANPRPCSPARAASMAAFRASRLVWLAISEITWMISPICVELVRISSMASTDFCTAVPPCSARTLVSLASLSAPCAAIP